MILRLYTHEIGFHTTYLAKFAKEAAEGFRESRDRLGRIPRLASMNPADMTLIDALHVSAVEHGFPDWPEMELRLRELEAGRAEERSMDYFHDVERGDLDAVERHLDAEPSLVNSVASTQKSALHSVGSAAMAELLLERGADPRIETMLPGGTALMHAIIWGWPDVAAVIAAVDRSPHNLRVAAGLNDVGAIHSAFDPTGRLKAAAKSGREYYRPNFGWFPWESSDHDQEVLDEALIFAATNGHLEAAKALVAKGAQIDGRAYETTPLMRATFRNRLEMIEWLLENGADPNARGWLGGHARGVTAFHIAAENGLVDVIRRLRAAGGSSQIRDDLYHSVPAGWARFHGHPELAERIESDTV